MPDTDFTPHRGKHGRKTFSEALDEKRHLSRARKALHDMVVFHEALQEAIQDMLSQSAMGAAIDKELLGKMVSVREKYQTAMQGLAHYDDQQEHLALVIYADSVQDVINHMNRQRRH